VTLNDNEAAERISESSEDAEQETG
jgi:hypothetical protein